MSWKTTYEVKTALNFFTEYVFIISNASCKKGSNLWMRNLK